jgi:hypothetical protein
MATTNNYNWPLFSSGADGWDAGLNGVLIDLDRDLKEFSSPLNYEDEMLFFEGDILGYSP